MPDSPGTSPRVSIFTCFRDTREIAQMYLRSLLVAEERLGWGPTLEYVLIDDDSAARSRIPDLLREFRSASRAANVTLLRFRRNMHYNYGVALGLSLCRGDVVLYFSHDMSVPADCISALLETARTYPDVPLLRPRSRHMDGAPQLAVEPPGGVSTTDHADAFAASLRRQFGATIAATDMFICDAALYRREIINRIGVFDTRYYGFWGDIDYGLRAQRAGFQHGIALGAWLHHVGKGVVYDAVNFGGRSEQEIVGEHKAQADAGYELFRQKWNPALPASVRDANSTQIAESRLVPPADLELYHPPLTVDPSVAEVL